MTRIYLDNAATTRVCDEAAQKALEVMTTCYGNPSSTHSMGVEAGKELKAAREKVARALGCAPSEITFTSGGTESDMWAIVKGVQSVSRHGKHIISSQTEHDAVRKSIDSLESSGFHVTRLAPSAGGSVSMTDFAAALRPETVFASLMLVNNETGAVSDIAAASKLLKSANPNALMHTDAVQGFLKQDFTPASLGADLVSISGHKIHAPKGVGALYIKNGLKIPQLILGGGQESERRAGTEGLAQIAAFGVAAELGTASMKASIADMQRLRSHAVSRLTAENPKLLVINEGAAHILSISLPGHRSETLMNFLGNKGIFVSKSSACKKGRRSHVLESMKLRNDVIDGALRVSLSRYTTMDEIDAFCDCLKLASDSLLVALR